MKVLICYGGTLFVCGLRTFLVWTVCSQVWGTPSFVWGMPSMVWAVGKTVGRHSSIH